jgi:hypothetical protein
MNAARSPIANDHPSLRGEGQQIEAAIHTAREGKLHARRQRAKVVEI